jgi:hypothetical protein
MRPGSILLLSCFTWIFLPKLLNFTPKPAAGVKRHAPPVMAPQSTVEVIHGTRRTVSIVSAPSDSEPKQ